MKGKKQKNSSWSGYCGIVFDFFQTKAKSSDIWGKEFLLPICKNVFYYHFPPPTPPLPPLTSGFKVLRNSGDLNYCEVNPPDQRNKAIKISISFSSAIMVNIIPKGLFSSGRAVNTKGWVQQTFSDHYHLVAASILTVNHLPLGTPTTPYRSDHAHQLSLPPTSWPRPGPSKRKFSLVEKLLWCRPSERR